MDSIPPAEPVSSASIISGGARSVKRNLCSSKTKKGQNDRLEKQDLHIFKQYTHGIKGFLQIQYFLQDLVLIW
jgi:hypothetical protein